jgi:YVTN family beta-propeller protein
LGPQYLESVNSHGLGWSRDGKYIVSLSLLSNTVTVVRTADNSIVSKAYVDRGPHEAFFAPDNRTVWIGTRGVSSVNVIDAFNATLLDRIFTAAGPSKVLFSGNGTLAYVNHIEDAIISVIDVPSRKVMYNITGLADIFSSDMMISANGETLWAAHKLVGKMSVIDLAARKVNAILDTGTETNHPNFAIINGTNHAFVTVGSLNATRVYRQAKAEDTPVLIKTIRNSGIQPHPLWPSPDNTRMYVANQHSDSIDVIDTTSLEIIHTFRASQDSQSLIYISNAVPKDNNGLDKQNLGEQGLGLRVENRLIPVNTTKANIGSTVLTSPLGNEPQALITIRETNGLDMFQIIGRDLNVNGTYTASALCHTCSEKQRTPILSFKASSLTNGMPGCGGNEQVLGFFKFFEGYDIDSIKIDEDEGEVARN